MSDHLTDRPDEQPTEPSIAELWALLKQQQVEIAELRSSLTAGEVTAVPAESASATSGATPDAANGHHGERQATRSAHCSRPAEPRRANGRQELPAGPDNTGRTAIERRLSRLGLLKAAAVGVAGLAAVEAEAAGQATPAAAAPPGFTFRNFIASGGTGSAYSTNTGSYDLGLDVFGATAGVFGRSTGGIGVSGLSTQSTGVAGSSTGGSGVSGTTQSDSDAGVLGLTLSTKGTSWNAGVTGISHATGSAFLGNGYGVQGLSNTGSAVFGGSYVDSAKVTPGSGIGVEGLTGTGTGVHGVSHDSSGALNAGTGVLGESGSGVGVKGASGSGVGVQGSTNRTYGNAVQGLAANGIGVSGQGLVGVVGNASGDGPGVAGYAGGAHGQGVFGYGPNGVVGQSDTGGADAAVYGYSTKNGIGVAGDTFSAPGTLGSGVGVQGQSGTGVGVRGAAASGRGGVFKGGAAQLQLQPASSGHPSSGQAGDLFVDSANNLWFCQGGTTWVQLGAAGSGGPLAGHSTTGATPGVLGDNNTNDPGSVGILGKSIDSGGNLGAGTGVEGDSGSGTGVKGNSSSGNGVWGTTAKGYDINGFGTSANEAGVYGSADSSDGYGYGVIGRTFNTTTGQLGNGFGVLGESNDGVGVRGTASTGVGVFGTTPQAGGTGVRGYGDTGVQATGTTYGVDCQGATGIQAVGNGQGGRGGIFQGSAAAILLQPGPDPNPPTSGLLGDLYMSESGSLWLCTVGAAGGGSATWRQIQLV